MRYKTVLLLLLMIVPAMLWSQDMTTAVTYNTAFPVGNLAGFTSEMSWRGLGLEFRDMKGQNMAFGFQTGWNVFSELAEHQTIEFDNAAISGTNVRSVNVFPILLNGDYFVGNKGEVRPFLGVSTGMYYISRQFDIGTVSFFEDHWHFGLAPEGGFWVPVDRRTFIVFTTRYNVAFSTGDTYLKQDNNQYSYWGFNIGFGYSYDL
jgi:hypothetical protein